MSQLVPFLTTEPLPPSRNDRSPVRRAVIILGVIALVLGSAWSVVTLRSFLPEQRAAVAAGQPVVVIVETGDSLTRVGGKLVAADVVTSVSAFLAAAEIDERSASIGPGVYNLLTGMAPGDVIGRMLDPAFRAAPLVLPEGVRLDDIVQLAADHTGLAPEQLRAALSSPGDLGLPTWAAGRPEGLLFPASYDLLPGSDATTVLGSMVRRFSVAAEEVELLTRAKRLGVSPYEIVIIASLVQAEAAPEDFRKVARVAYNRLEQGLPLQFDSTINYALGTSTLLVTETMLAVDSPYNTYQRTGLPPTPINSPGQDALEAALNPAEGDWLYFVTVNPATRETRFTASYDEFLEFKEMFREAYAAMMASATSTPAASTDPTAP